MSATTLHSSPAFAAGLAVASAMGTAWLQGYDDAIAGLPSPGEGVSAEEQAYSMGYRAGLQALAQDAQVAA